MVERTRTAQAVFQGDESRSSRWGFEHRGDRITAAAIRLIDSPRQQPASPQSALTPPALPAPPVRIWTPEDALNTNTRTKLALGADTVTGQIFKCDMLQAPHLRVHGKSQGSGKTNTIQTLAAGAVRTGAHLVISKFGARCATAQAEGVLDDVLYPLSLILREAGSAGVHVLIEDQVVEQRLLRACLIPFTRITINPTKKTTPWLRTFWRRLDLAFAGAFLL